MLYSMIDLLCRHPVLDFLSVSPAKSPGKQGTHTNFKQKFSCLEIKLLLPTKSRQNYLWELFFIIKGKINRCYVDIKLFQAWLSQLTNRENRKLIPSGMLLYITVFFFLSHHILCDYSAGFNRREYIILTIECWCIVGDCDCARSIWKMFLHFQIFRVTKHTALITSDHKLHWRWIWEGKGRCDFWQNLLILFQFKAIHLCQQLVWQTKLA